MEINVDELGELDARDVNRLEMHSILNVLSVVAGELSLIEHFLSGAWELSAGRNLCQNVINSLDDSVTSLAHLRRVREYASRILADIDHGVRSAGQSHAKEIKRSISNIENVLGILSDRADDILARMEQPLAWRETSCTTQVDTLTNFLNAVAQNSRGRYGIVFNLAEQGIDDYYVAINVDSAYGKQIYMPPIVSDVLRDLVANARKYSSPGGFILVGVRESATHLSLAVRDNGIGIPEADVDRVVKFGERGSNVGGQMTHGGGFGLTKAAWVAQRFGGTLQIESEERVGTYIRFSIPLPANRKSS